MPCSSVDSLLIDGGGGCDLFARWRPETAASAWNIVEMTRLHSLGPLLQLIWCCTLLFLSLLFAIIFLLKRTQKNAAVPSLAFQ